MSEDWIIKILDEVAEGTLCIVDGAQAIRAEMLRRLPKRKRGEKTMFGSPHGHGIGYNQALEDVRKAVLKGEHICLP